MPSIRYPPRFFAFSMSNSNYQQKESQDRQIPFDGKLELSQSPLFIERIKSQGAPNTFLLQRRKTGIDNDQSTPPHFTTWQK